MKVHSDTNSMKSLVYDKILKKNGKDKEISGSYESNTFWNFALLPFVYCPDIQEVSM